MGVEYIRQTLENIADCFYQERNNEGLQMFMQVAGELGRIPELSDNINPLFDALEGDDYILAADIICHEMLVKLV